MTESADAERQFVFDRAHGRCEYCLYPERAAMLPFLVGRIISEKHGGSSEVENAAFTCPFCHRAKGADLASIDPETDQLTSLFNPRTQTWSEHFPFGRSRNHPVDPLRSRHSQSARTQQSGPHTRAGNAYRIGHVPVKQSLPPSKRWSPSTAYPPPRSAFRMTFIRRSSPKSHPTAPALSAVR